MLVFFQAKNHGRINFGNSPNFRTNNRNFNAINRPFGLDLDNTRPAKSSNKQRDILSSLEGSGSNSNNPNEDDEDDGFALDNGSGMGTDDEDLPLNHKPSTTTTTTTTTTTEKPKTVTIATSTTTTTSTPTPVPSSTANEINFIKRPGFEDDEDALEGSGQGSSDRNPKPDFDDIEGSGGNFLVD